MANHKPKTTIDQLVNQIDRHFIRQNIKAYQRFHRLTKNRGRGEKIDPSDWPPAWKEIRYKAYSRFPTVQLKHHSPLSSDLPTVLRRRISTREFGHHLLNINQLSSIIYYSAGINSSTIQKRINWNEVRRFYPSAGARYPLEIYPVVLKSKEINKGAYHYNVKTNCLEKLIFVDQPEKIFKSIYQEEFKTASTIIIITAVFSRTTCKYQDRGYRFLFLEAGHLAQNLYLIAADLDLGCCAIGGYCDEKIEKFLDINNRDESVIYILAVG